ncbi:hypothetical protein PLICRDRAFT_55093 [Plicaturopsis crispa FD-325 SS-3]|nr:hypothetical protein PLICRDRAFT_55093 [Plicaturopsis crispa FD-325 SS-3]
MGSKSDHSRNRDTDIAEKNKQIANLETQIEAHIARTSHLHARLLSTLDALDDVQAHYAHDVASLRRTKDRLSDKLDRYITFVNTIEDEKDDMRDAVLKLVEKVEQCSDYTQWPQSRMRITSLLDPLAHEHAHHEKSNDDLFAYAAAMIGSLTQARDAERDAHAHTLHHVAALEAQLARRDAELAQCTYDHRPRHMPYEPHPRAKSPRADLVMSQDEAITVLTMTSAKNKALEMEVKVLAERLENARATTGSAARRVDATSAGKDAQDGNAHASSSARRETQPATTGLHPVAASPPSTRTTVPDSGPSASDRREGPGRLRPPQIEASGDTVAHSRSRDTPRRAPRPPRETRRDQSRARSQGPRRRHPQAHSRERRQSSPENALMPLVPTRDASPPLQMESSSAVAALERQVRALASTVDAFKEERRLLGEVLQRERPSTVRQKPDQVAISESSVLVSQPESSQPRKLHAEPQNGLGFGSVRSLEDRLREMEEHLRAAEERLGENEERCRQTEARLQVREDECTRLARSEQALRDQLALSEIRERELLGEINHLKRRSSQSPGQPAERRSSVSKIFSFHIAPCANAYRLTDASSA